MKRKVVSIAAWLVATAASIVLATAAVGNVGWGDDRPALQATVSSVVTLPPTTPTTALGIEPSTSTVDPSTTLAAPTSTSAVAAPDSTVTTTTTAPTTSTTQPPTTTQAPPSTTTTSAPTTTTQAPQGDYFKSFQLIGGWVQLRVSGDNVYLAAHVPETGFTVDVEHDGPETVEIEFKSESHDSKLHARVKDGELDVDKDEESEDD